jgi:hypothetical protein
MTTAVLTPVGRLVQGDPFTAQDKDYQGNPRVVLSGPNAGQPNPQFYIGVAFAKTDPLWPAFRAGLDAIAKAGFPALFPDALPPGNPGFPGEGGGLLRCVHPTFSWKIVDGDGLDTSGKSHAAKDGFAGHWIVRFASAYPPKVFPMGRYSPLDQITDKNLVRRGYYVRVHATVEPNGNLAKPGLYVNLGLVELCAQGVEIQSGINAADAFATPAVLPPGAQPLPGTPVPVGATPAPLAPAPAAAVVAPPPAPSAPPATPSPTRIMTAAANGLTYEQYVAAGWTEAQLVAGGLLAV